MRYTELLLTSFGLSMDAFSAAVCRGTTLKKRAFPVGIVTALFFGIFQAIMPLTGYYLGNGFIASLERYSNHIAFVLLTVIGLKMIIESRAEDETESTFSIGQLFLLAVATSIDAMAVGLIFAVQGTKPFIPSAVIGAVTFAVSAVGVYIGRKFGAKWEKKAEIAGGVVLVLIGIKFLLDGIK